MKLLAGNTGTQASHQGSSSMDSTATAAAPSPPSSSTSSLPGSTSAAATSHCLGNTTTTNGKNSNSSGMNGTNTLANGSGNGIHHGNVKNTTNTNNNNRSSSSSSSNKMKHLAENNNGNSKTMISLNTTETSFRKPGSKGDNPSNNNNNNNTNGSFSMNGNTTTTATNHSSNNNNSTNTLAAQQALVLAGETEDDAGLEFVQARHTDCVLASINTLRHQRQFCDISLIVEEQEFPAHRAVLAACSPHLFDFITCLEETSEQQPIYKLGRDLPAAGFRPLLDFMYTGRLSVPVESVPTVYATALDLKMEAATRACADFLSTHLTVANCLDIRRLTKDKGFKETVDKYICTNLDDIINGKDFFGLTELQVEVVGLDEEISDEAMERRMFSLVLDWAKNNLNDLKPKMDRLIEQVNVLYLDSDNTLRDCAQVEDLVLSSDDEVVQDYKIMARRRSHQQHKKDAGKLPMKPHAAQPFQKFSLNPEEAVSVAEREWSIIAIHRTSDKAYLAIAVLDGHLMAVSVHVRPQIPNGANGVGDYSSEGHHSSTNGQHSNGSSVSSKPDSPTAVASGRNGGGVSPTTIQRKASIIPLANMSTARCAMGAVEWDGKLVVSGGYDRGECLQGVEAFSIETNTWSPLPAMHRARGRFSMAVLDGGIYVCGGSDGWHELACVERFDPVSQTWSYVASMMKQRSSHGVATLKGKLYCVGGCEGQRSMEACEVYNPATNKWSQIAPLNTARSQACVVAVDDNLLAIGGTDMWNTLSSVEVYNPKTNEWTMTSCLNIARRGASVDLVGGQVVVVGGSDGSHSLTSSEVLDTATNTWTMGPPLIMPRANLSVVAMGTRLFALGGFSGKKFLSSVEWLDLEDMEWFGHTPRDLGRTEQNGAKA